MAKKSATAKISKKFKKKRLKLSIQAVKAKARAQVKGLKKAARKSR